MLWRLHYSNIQEKEREFAASCFYIPNKIAKGIL